MRTGWPVPTMHVFTCGISTRPWSIFKRGVLWFAKLLCVTFLDLGKQCGKRCTYWTDSSVGNWVRRTNQDKHSLNAYFTKCPLISSFMWPIWGQSGAGRTQVGPMLASWTLLSGSFVSLFSGTWLYWNFTTTFPCAKCQNDRTTQLGVMNERVFSGLELKHVFLILQQCMPPGWGLLISSLLLIL